MDRVRSFYEKQHLWANVYAGDVEDYHRDKARSVNLPEREPPYNILELGCGGGQVAAALADLGHFVVAVDINPEAVRNPRLLAESRPYANITLVEEDFYSFTPEDRFDAVCYFDGFGVGTDEDQRKLLQRIA